MVDDDPDVLWAFEQILRGTGHVVTTTARGTEALAQVAGAEYDLAFIDAKLPDLDSQELARRIMDHSPRTVRILVSGYFGAQDPEVVMALKERLFAGFVAKPFSIGEIRQIGQHVIQTRRRERDGGTDPGRGR